MAARRSGRSIPLVFVAVIALVVAVALPALAQQTHVVDVQDDRYAPATIEVIEGDTVRWTQSGSNPHTVTASDGSFDSHPDCNNFADAAAGNCMAQGDTYEQTFTETGEVDYYCKLHGTSGGAGMAGTVVVAAAAEEEPPAEESDEPAEEDAPTEDAPAEDAPAEDDDTADATDDAEDGVAGDLPETGLPLGVLAIIGLALLGAGLVAKRRT
jgi:LPXTG-motif cell wall-anchored protein